MSAAPSVRARVLVVEDEPAIADTICYALTTDGFEPDWCSTGAAALEALAAGDPVLVILDVGLPDINGFELFKQIDGRTRAPLIFLTARAVDVDRIVGLELGADDYVAKPFSPRELTARVRAVLNPDSAVMYVGAPIRWNDQIVGAVSVGKSRPERRERVRPRRAVRRGGVEPGAAGRRASHDGCHVRCGGSHAHRRALPAAARTD